MSRVFVIAPHMDDEVIGPGGTIKKHVESGDEVHVCIVAHRVYDREYSEEDNAAERACTLKAKDVLGYRELTFLDLPDERLDACVQDVLAPLEACYNKARPEIVYMCHYGDNHQDHRAVFAAARIIVRRCGSLAPRKVCVYEAPSSTEQSPPIASEAFLPNYFVDISRVLKSKLDAVRAYDRESRPFPHPRSVDAIENLAVRRGVESALGCAEAFMVLYDQWQ